MKTKASQTGRGPFVSSQIPEGSRYELSDGHAIYCAPTGARGSQSNLVGGAVLDTDPAVESAGVDTGFSPEPGMLRAPDIAVGNVPNEPGWVRGVPPLAVEYADVGQDEAELHAKIAELLNAGTRYVWVVRLVGPRRVEVHESGKPVRIVTGGDDLAAPGVLKNRVPVEALYDREAAHEQVLRNLLQRKGYESLEALRNEGKIEGKIEGVLVGRIESVQAALETRGIPLTEKARERLSRCRDLDVLDRWLRRAITMQAGADEILD
jgi:Uma2 family endonuclease